MHTIADKHLTTEQEGIGHLDTAGSIFFKASLCKPQWGGRGIYGKTGTVGDKSDISGRQKE